MISFAYLKKIIVDIELNSLTQLQDAIEKDAGFIAYFYSDHCAPCISLRPKVNALLAEDFPKMNLYFINSEKYPAISASFGIFASPTLLVYFDRKEYLRKSKFISIPELSQEIERLYAMMFED